MRFCRRYWCFSSLRQGISAHSSLGLSSGALVCSMRLALLLSTVSGLRQRILGITPGVIFSDHPLKQMLEVATCSRYRFCVRAICSFLLPHSPFSFSVYPHLSTT